MIFTRTRKRDGVTVFYVRYRDPEGRRRDERAGTTRKQAERLYKKRVGEVISGTWTDPQVTTKEPNAPVTFRSFHERFITEYARPHTRSKHYDQHLTSALEYFGDKPLAVIKRADLDRFALHRKMSKSRAKGRKKPIGAATIRKEITALGTFFRKAVEWELIEASPAVGLKKPPEPKHKRRFLSREEWVRLLEASPAWLRPILRMTLAQGLRRKEAAFLTWDHVDLRAGLIYVNEDSKTATPDPIPLTAEGRAVLVEMDARRRDLGRELGRVLTQVFVNDEGKPYDTPKTLDRISQGARHAMKVAGIEGASLHTLRHTCASWMVQAGVPLAEVQRYLRHRNVQTTLRYAHLQPEHLKASVAALDSALSAKRR